MRGVKPIPIDLLRAHSDPFYNECRAFGRIDDAGQNGKIAVRCYGYMTLPAATEAQLAKSYRLEWDRPGEDNDKSLSQRQPFRAIVKDLIHDDIPLSQILVNKMLRDLKKIRALGVYPMDIRKRNYRGGLLLDMSVAMTRPHYLFKIYPKWRIDDLMRHDLVDIEGMANEEGFKCIALRNEEYCTKLRPRSGKKPIYK